MLSQQKMSNLIRLSEVFLVLFAMVFITSALSLLVYFLSEGFLSGVSNLVSGSANEKLLRDSVVIAPLGSLGTVGVVVSLLKARGLSLIGLGLHWSKRWEKVFGYSLVLTVVILIVGIGFELLLAHFGLKPDFSDFKFVEGDLFFYLFAITVFTWVSAAFTEEVVFRGFILNNLKSVVGEKEMGWQLANVGQATLFAVMHFNQGWGGVIPIFFVGLTFGYLYIRSGRSLWIPIVTHGMIDMIGFTQLYFGFAEI